jgi:Skp family chaperone for outer membrane proteins
VSLLTAPACHLQEMKKEMAKIISVIAKAAEAREVALAEMAALKTHADKEQAAFEAEWKKLGSIIDQDKRNRELLRQREMEERNRKTQEVCTMSRASRQSRFCRVHSASGWHCALHMSTCQAAQQDAIGCL